MTAPLTQVYSSVCTSCRILGFSGLCNLQFICLVCSSSWNPGFSGIWLDTVVFSLFLDVHLLWDSLDSWLDSVYLFIFCALSCNRTDYFPVICIVFYLPLSVFYSVSPCNDECSSICITQWCTCVCVCVCHILAWLHLMLHTPLWLFQYSDVLVIVTSQCLCFASIKLEERDGTDSFVFKEAGQNGRQ